MKNLLFIFCLSFLMLFSCSDSGDESENNSDNFSIGDYYQGGYIAHIYTTGEPGYIANEVHGIIAAPQDATGSFFWSGQDEIVGTSVQLGSGSNNTSLILDSFSAANELTAAEAASDFEIDAYSDWVLPSQAELSKLFYNLYLKGVTNFHSGWYWSSSEENEEDAYAIYFTSDGGSYQARSKRGFYSYYKVRCVRYF